MTTINFKDQLEKIEDLLFGFAMKLTRNREQAKDLMQETLMRAYENRDRFQMGTHFKSWMTTIMYNSHINHYRRKKTRNKVEQPVDNIVYLEDKNVTEGRGEQMILRKELNTILDRLDIKYRKPFLMHFRGFQYDEIATEMELPIGTVKSRIHYARKELKKMITVQYGTELMRA